LSNSYFQFKQFRIEQDKCAMKVSTDACIQGAWTPVADARNILDVGAGTGLLSLMLAQRQPQARITAIEKDEAAAKQACENFVASPFANRIGLFVGDALRFDFDQPSVATPTLQSQLSTLNSPLSTLHFNLIICNPPFFQHSLKGPDAARNAARHTDTLNPRSLAEIFQKHLVEDGVASIMFPPESYAQFRIEALMLGLKEERLLIVRDRAGSRITRMIGVWKKTSSTMKTVEEELLIKDADGKYSEQFVGMMREFYLHL
jgi:tRNA1Val (adenine37-N6)-methyltransferase